MPNGLNISKESDSWRALESPLVEIDLLLTSFAEHHGMYLSKNHHNWPERTMDWSSRGLRRGIQIVLANPKEQTYSIRTYASMGAGQTWLSNESFLRKEVPWSDIATALNSLLTEGYNIAEQWSERDLNTSRRINVSEILRNKKG